MKKWCAALAASTIVLATAGCDAGGSDGPSIVVYNAQHEQLLERDRPDVHRRRPGSRSSCATAATPSWPPSSCRRATRRRPTSSSPRTPRPCRQVERAGLFAPAGRRRRSTPIPAQYRPRERPVDRLRRPLDGAGLQHRAWSTSRPSCRTSIMDLADPEWQGRISFSPTGADFQAIVARGARPRRARRPPRRGWPASRPTARRTTATTWSSSRSTPAESDVGIIYHYYWYRDQAESGDNSDNTAAPLLRQPGPRRLRQRLRRGRAEVRATTRRGRRSSSRTSPARRASRRSPTATRWSTRSTRPRRSGRRSSRSTSWSRRRSTSPTSTAGRSSS